MTIASPKTERVNLRISSVALQELRDAAVYQGQDLTSFVLSAALNKARTIAIAKSFLTLQTTEHIELTEEVLKRWVEMTIADNEPSDQLQKLIDSSRALLRE